MSGVAGPRLVGGKGKRKREKRKRERKEKEKREDGEERRGEERKEREKKIWGGGCSGFPNFKIRIYSVFGFSEKVSFLDRFKMNFDF